MFANKQIIFISRDGIEFPALIVECVKDVGISIVHAEDKTKYLYCLRMKLAPTFSNKKGAITSTRKRFTEIRKMIIEGVVDISKSKVHGRALTSVPQTQCAFN